MFDWLCIFAEKVEVEEGKVTALKQHSYSCAYLCFVKAIRRLLEGCYRNSRLIAGRHCNYLHHVLCFTIFLYVCEFLHKKIAAAYPNSEFHLVYN